MKISERQNNKGFAIVETLVAIFILLLSITGPMVVAQNGLRAAYLARDQITAFYLGQDAMEYVRNIRDDNLLEGVLSTSGSTWMNGLEDCLAEVGNVGCTIDTASDGGVALCPNGDGCDLDNPLYLNPSTGGFGFDDFNNTEQSRFSRVITIKDTVSGQEMEVTVTITWITHDQLGERKIEVSSSMFNWLDV